MGKRKLKLRLYVWEGFAPDWTDGLAFAIASDKDEAMKIVTSAVGYSPMEWGGLSIHELDAPFGAATTGGS